MTSQTAFRETPEFIRGRDAEILVAGWLQRQGYYILPAFDFCGEHGTKAPGLFGPVDRITLPDLSVAYRGTMRLAEVKAKRRATFTHITGTYDHGIGHRKWLHYRRAQRETGCHVWLYIFEEDTQTLLAGSLDDLGVGRRYWGDAMDPGGMMFWPREAFKFRELINTLPGLFEAHTNPFGDTQAQTR